MTASFQTLPPSIFSLNLRHGRCYTNNLQPLLRSALTVPCECAQSIHRLLLSIASLPTPKSNVSGAACGEFCNTSPSLLLFLKVASVVLKLDWLPIFITIVCTCAAHVQHSIKLPRKYCLSTLSAALQPSKRFLCISKSYYISTPSPEPQYPSIHFIYSWCQRKYQEPMR